MDSLCLQGVDFCAEIIHLLASSLTRHRRTFSVSHLPCGGFVAQRSHALQLAV